MQQKVGKQVFDEKVDDLILKKEKHVDKNLIIHVSTLHHTGPMNS